MRDAAKQRGLDNVRFTGNVDKNLIPDVLALSDVCLVHLRESETFTVVMPSKIFEAAAMARPIILGIRGFAEAFVLKAGCGLCIEPENEEELVEAVLRLEADSDLRAELGKAGCAYVVNEFDRDRLAARYLTIIDRIVHQGGIRA